MTYVQEDDIVLIDWVTPDEGGLTTSYIVEVLSGSGTFITVDQNTECSEKGQGVITQYVVPAVSATNAPTQCTMAVETLKSKYGLAIGDTVKARITSYHIVGSCTTSTAGAGTAVFPQIPCFRTTFPRLVGGSNQDSSVTAFDIDSLGNIITGGST